jgi:arginase
VHGIEFFIVLSSIDGATVAVIEWRGRSGERIGVQQLHPHIVFSLELGTGKTTSIPKGADFLMQRLPQKPKAVIQTKHSNDCCTDKRSTDSPKFHRELVHAFEDAQVHIQKHQVRAVIGGDCSSDFALCASQLAMHDDLAVIWIDTHADLNTPQSSPSGHFHGMVLRALLGMSTSDLAALNPKPLQPNRLIMAGLRETDPEEARFIAAHQIPVLTVDELHANPRALVEKIVELGFKRIHIHLDLDVLDAREFVSTGFPSVGGLSVSCLIEMLATIRQQMPIHSFAMTEYAPTDQRDDWVVVESVWRILNGS